MVCLRNICINTLHKGDNDDTNNNNNNNNNVWTVLRPVPTTYASENVSLRYDVVLVGIIYCLYITNCPKMEAVNVNN